MGKVCASAYGTETSMQGNAVASSNGQSTSCIGQLPAPARGPRTTFVLLGELCPVESLATTGFLHKFVSGEPSKGRMGSVRDDTSDTLNTTHLRWAGDTKRIERCPNYVRKREPYDGASRSETYRFR